MKYLQILITMEQKDLNSINQDELNIPAVLPPGKSLDMPVYFVAPQKGNLSAELRSLSDADTDVTCLLTGYGIVQGIRVTTDYIPMICYGSKDTINCSVENYGNGSINVTSIKLVQNLNQFYFDNPSDALGFNLYSGQSETVKLIFEPVIPGVTEIRIL